MTRMPTDTFTITVEVVPPACPDADFLHRKVAGIAVAREIRDRMRRAENPVAEGVKNAVEALTLARERFAGACVMPPFDRYEILTHILHGSPGC